MIGGGLEGIARSAPVGEAPRGGFLAAFWLALCLADEGEVSGDKLLLGAEGDRPEDGAIGRRGGELELVAGSLARPTREDETAFARNKRLLELHRVAPEEELIAGDPGIDSPVGEAVAAVFVDVAAYADAEAGAAVVFESLWLLKAHRHREAAVRSAQGFRQGVDAAIARRNEAFRPAVAHLPVLHRIRPELATEKNAIRGAVPSVKPITGLLRRGLAFREEAKDGERRQPFEGEAAGKATDHGKGAKRREGGL